MSEDNDWAKKEAGRFYSENGYVVEALSASLRAAEERGQKTAQRGIASYLRTLSNSTHDYSGLADAVLFLGASYGCQSVALLEDPIHVAAQNLIDVLNNPAAFTADRYPSQMVIDAVAALEKVLEQ